MDQSNHTVHSGLLKYCRVCAEHLVQQAGSVTRPSTARFCSKTVFNIDVDHDDPKFASQCIAIVITGRSIMGHHIRRGSLQFESTFMHSEPGRGKECEGKYVVYHRYSIVATELQLHILKVQHHQHCALLLKYAQNPRLFMSDLRCSIYCNLLHRPVLLSTCHAILCYDSPVSVHAAVVTF